MIPDLLQVQIVDSGSWASCFGLHICLVHVGLGMLYTFGVWVSLYIARKGSCAVGIQGFVYMGHRFESDSLPVADGILLQGLMRPALYSRLPRAIVCGDNAGEHVMCNGSLRM